MSSLKLTNPHSVLAALQQRPQDVLEVHASAKRSSAGWQGVVELAKQHGISVREPIARKEPGGRAVHRDGGRLGNTYAVVRELQGVSIRDLFSQDVSRGLWLALDQLQDPHNVGAIFRTAAFFGIRGIVMTVNKSAPLTPTVYDIASGGVETVPFTQLSNLSQAIEVAKKSDMWVLGTSEHESMPVSEVDRDRRWLLVVGNEEKGLRRLTQERCDQVCCIPPRGEVTSLNVSVAAGVLMSHLTAD